MYLLLGTMNNDDVTSSIEFEYESICLDFLRRYESGYMNTTELNDIKNQILDNNSYYIFYGDNNNSNGTSMLDSGTYNDSYLRIVFYNPSGYNYTISFSNFTYYMGLQSNHILSLTRTTGAFGGYRVPLYSSTSYYTTPELYLPSELMNYNSKVIFDYFIGGKSLQEIEKQLEQANATLTDINNSLTDDSFDDTQDNPIEMEIFEDYNEDYQDNLFNNVLERFYNNIPNSTSSIYSINIPIPHSNGQYITLYSNAISKYINYFSQPMLYTFIQACWYVVFFKYFFWFGKKVLDWILTGELLEKGGGAFIKSLEKENAVVNAAMM